MHNVRDVAAIGERHLYSIFLRYWMKKNQCQIQWRHPLSNATILMACRISGVLLVVRKLGKNAAHKHKLNTSSEHRELCRCRKGASIRIETHNKCLILTQSVTDSVFYYLQTVQQQCSWSLLRDPCYLEGEGGPTKTYWSPGSRAVMLMTPILWEQGIGHVWVNTWNI